MSDENTFIMNGIKTQWDDDTITITEIGFRHKATVANDGTIIKSTFGKDGRPFVESYFRRMKPFVDKIRAIDREYANA